jgi:hypothetical protein
LVVELGVPSDAKLVGNVILALSDDLWTQIDLTLFPDGSLKPAYSFDLSSLPLYSTTSRVPVLQIDGISYLTSSFRLEHWVRNIDWTSDQQFSADLAKRVKKFLPTERVAELGGIPAITLALREISSEITGRSDLVAFHERLEGFLHSENLARERAEELFDLVKHSAWITDKIAVSAKSLHDESVPSIRAEIEAQIIADWDRTHMDLIKSRASLVAEINAADIRNKSLLVRVSDVRKKVETAETALSTTIDGVRGALERAPKNHVDRARRIAEQLERAIGISGASGVFPSETPPWGLDDNSSQKSISHSELSTALDQKARRFGMTPIELRYLDALVRAGECVLVGQDCGIVFEAYANVVSGGRIRRQILDLGIVGIDDLWRQPGNGNPTALAHAWTAAKAKPDRAILLVLETIQETYGWRWIMPFQRILRTERPSNLLILLSVTGKPKQDEEDFENSSSGLIRVGVKASDGAEIIAATHNMKLSPGDPTMLVDRFEPMAVPPDEIAHVIGDVLVTRPMDREQATRAASLYMAARITMDLADATELVSSFADHVLGRSIKGPFADLTDRFEPSTPNQNIKKN